MDKLYLIANKEEENENNKCNYLILDETLLETTSISFRQFIKSIFFIGTGHKQQPIDHIQNVLNNVTFKKN